MEIAGRKSLVLGAGKSGVASALFLAQRGAVVALYDRKPVENWSAPARALKESHGVGLIGERLESWLLDQIDLVVISPGVPTDSIPARYVDRKDGEVIGEVELAYRFLRGRLVGITGSNGKTTTTTLVGKILKDAGIDVQIGGNIGTPLIDLVDSSTESGWTVAELSSFQLETIRELKADVAACLNVTPNHLDRYASFTDYAAAKHRIFKNQDSHCVAVLNADDQIVSSWADTLSAKVCLFSVKRSLPDGLFLRGDKLIYSVSGRETIILPRREIFLRGIHNVENILAACAIGLACGATLETIRHTVSEFRGVEHRIEFVAEFDGVRFYNDSKATSVDAAVKAVEALAEGGGKTVLILGGRGKNAPYAPLAPLIQTSVRALVLIGEDAANIEAQLGGIVPITHSDNMSSAVRSAFSAAAAGDVVLLAPACASFDMFRSFEHRGEVFKSEVARLGNEQSAAAEA